MSSSLLFCLHVSIYHAVSVSISSEEPSCHLHLHRSKDTHVSRATRYGRESTAYSWLVLFDGCVHQFPVSVSSRSPHRPRISEMCPSGSAAPSPRRRCTGCHSAPHYRGCHMYFFLTLCSRPADRAPLDKDRGAPLHTRTQVRPGSGTLSELSSTYRSTCASRRESHREAEGRPAPGVRHQVPGK